MTDPVKNPYATLEAIQARETAVQERLDTQKAAQIKAIAAAKQEARAMLAQAEVDGRAQGEADFARERAAIEHEVTMLLDQARREAQIIRREGEQAITTAVAQAVAFIIEGDQ